MLQRLSHDAVCVFQPADQRVGPQGDRQPVCCPLQDDHEQRGGCPSGAGTVPARSADRCGFSLVRLPHLTMMLQYLTLVLQHFLKLIFLSCVYRSVESHGLFSDRSYQLWWLGFPSKRTWRRTRQCSAAWLCSTHTVLLWYSAKPHLHHMCFLSFRKLWYLG